MAATREAAESPNARYSSGGHLGRFASLRLATRHLAKPGSTEPATRFGCRDTQTGAPLKLG